MIFVDVHTGLPCFRDLATMLTHLSREDIDKLTKYYLQGKQPEVARQTMIDALGTAQTSDCYTVMMRQVFLIKQPEAELLMRALFQLIDLSTPTPEVYNLVINVCYIWHYEICNYNKPYWMHEIILKLTLCPFLVSVAIVKL